jgi:hypothetical protein
MYEIQSSKYLEISFLSYLLWKKELCLSQMSQKKAFSKTNQSHHLIARAYRTTIAKLAWGFRATL